MPVRLKVIQMQCCTLVVHISTLGTSGNPLNSAHTAIAVWVSPLLFAPLCALTACLHRTHSFEQPSPDLRPLGVQGDGQTAVGHLLVCLTDATDALGMSLPEATQTAQMTRVDHSVQTPILASSEGGGNALGSPSIHTYHMSLLSV